MVPAAGRRCNPFIDVAIVPASALPHRGDRALPVRRLVRPAVVRKVGILTLGDRALSPAAASFREIFKTHFAATMQRRPTSRRRAAPESDGQRSGDGGVLPLPVRARG
jgi:hypothetical protein